MDALPLWNDTIESALIDVLRGVYGRGWAQKAAAEMFPTDDPINKGKWLEKALDRDRDEKLSLSDLLWILRKGREHGLHAAMFFLADECNYSRPVTTDPADKKAELQREFIQAVKLAESIGKRLEGMK